MTVETDHPRRPGTAPETLRAMAAIVRTVFGVALQPPSVEPASVATPVATTGAPGPATLPPVAPVPVPLPEMTTPATVEPVVLPVETVHEARWTAPPVSDTLAAPSWVPSESSSPVVVAMPSIPLPESMPVVSERHSLALLQEIAFLDD